MLVTAPVLEQHFPGSVRPDALDSEGQFKPNLAERRMLRYVPPRRSCVTCGRTNHLPGLCTGGLETTALYRAAEEAVCAYNRAAAGNRRLMGLGIKYTRGDR